jgi:hypothetical protein
VFRGRAKNIPNYVVVKDMEIQNQQSIAEWQKEIDIMAYATRFGFGFGFCLGFGLGFGGGFGLVWILE